MWLIGLGQGGLCGARIFLFSFVVLIERGSSSSERAVCGVFGYSFTEMVAVPITQLL